MITELQKNLLRRGTIGDAFRRSAKRLGSKIMIVAYDHKDERHVFSYKQMNELSNRFAHAMLGRGISKGTKVAIMSHNIPEFLISWFGCTKIGAVFATVNFSYNKDEVNWQVNNAEPEVFIVEEGLVDMIDSLRPELKSVKHFIAISLNKGVNYPKEWSKFEEWISEKYSADEPEVEIYDDDLMMLAYTSGTTAHPKGVMLTHRNYLSSTIPAWILDLRLKEDDVWLYYLPFYTIAGLGSITTLSVIGMTMVLNYNVNPETALQRIERERPTIISQTPTFYIRVSQHPNFSKTNFDSVRGLLTYGGLIPRGMVEDYIKLAPNALWMTYWGQSELGQLGSAGWFRHIEDIPDQDPSWIGKPVHTLEGKVVDQDGKEVTSGVGELWCRGASVMLGYYKDEKNTAEVMEEGWIHTGDLVRRDENWNMFFFDRSKDMLKTGGMNVSSFEVQDAIYKSPKVMDCAVIGTPDPYWSEIVTAFVVLKKGEELTEQELISFCKEQLTAYKVPKKVLFVNDLPRDSQGKILKRILREQIN